MYAISYVLQLGMVVHRARSAKAAIEAVDLLRAGGATVLKIVITRNGKEVSVARLRELAEDER